MYLDVLVKHRKEDVRDLPLILDSFNPSLGNYIDTIGNHTLISRLNPESSWDDLVRNLEFQGYDVLLVFEWHQSGSCEIFYPPPAPTGTTDDPADEGARALHDFKRRLRLRDHQQKCQVKAKEAAAQAKRRSARRARYFMKKAKKRAGGK